MKNVAESFFDDSHFPLGIRLLFELMQKHRHDLLGYNIVDLIPCETSTTKELLGSGTFGVVVGDKINNSVVWKISTFPKEDMAKEIAALNAIGNDDTPEGSDRSNLPRLLRKEVFPLRLGRLTKCLPCLKLEPRGQPVLSLNNLDRSQVIKASACNFSMEKVLFTATFLQRILYLWDAMLIATKELFSWIWGWPPKRLQN